MLVRIKKVETKSMAKVLGIIQGFVGLITGVIFTAIVLINPEAAEGGTVGVFGVWSFVILPVLNGLLGLATGALLGGTYNFCVRKFNSSISIDIENV